MIRLLLMWTGSMLHSAYLFQTLATIFPLINTFCEQAIISNTPIYVQHITPYTLEQLRNQVGTLDWNQAFTETAADSTYKYL